MGLIHYGIPQQLVLAAKNRFGIRTFIETGTFRGDTAEFAATHFERVFTVEFVNERYLKAQQRLRVHPNVTCLQGNSPDALRRIAPRLEATPTLFWLDAHWNGDAESREFECPVVGELEAINEANLDAFILIDDARYFLAPPPLPCNPDVWPTLPQLLPLLAHSNRYVIMVDDAILAWPSSCKQFLIDHARSRPPAWAPPAPAQGGIFYIPRDRIPQFTIGR